MPGEQEGRREQVGIGIQRHDHRCEARYHDNRVNPAECAQQHDGQYLGCGDRIELVERVFENTVRNQGRDAPCEDTRREEQAQFVDDSGQSIGNVSFKSFDRTDHPMTQNEDRAGYQ